MVLATRKLRDLDVSAASGIVVADGRLHVVADDMLDLIFYSADGERFLGSVPLFPGGLPGGKLAKAHKPDLEALALLLAPCGLLAMGSGSLPNRRRGAWLPEGPEGTINPVDLSPLYAALTFEELNIEGAARLGDRLRLMQRGNGKGRENAVVDLDCRRLVSALAEDRPLPADLVMAVHHVELGELDGIAWSFTDGAPLADGGILFSAVAEDTENAYDDGPCVGAALGILDDNGRLVAWDELDIQLKVEGVHAFASGEAFLVADADDPARPSPLLSVRWTDLSAASR